MERREVAAVLAYIGRLDPRTIRTDPGEARDQLAQWHELLHDVPFATDHGWDVREAIRAHVLGPPYPILPVDVARAWRTYRRDRIDRHTDPTPAADPDDPTAWRAELLGTRQAVATGTAAPSTHRQLTNGGPHPDVEARVRAIGSCVPPTIRAALAPYRPARAAREAAVAAGLPDSLGVGCPWCHAREGEPCRSRRVGPDGRARGNAPRTTPHPTRLDLAAAEITRQGAA
ncbi:zinc finger domain-containing protein [Streptomyces cinerochromogenes]|uniref:zinc finger domain-containing protein n=1 Tax=Streptomyces cinerochromogenes TaxID=66422 RepID=UPI0033B35064